jgi:NAD(P)-dependent dehydrogenase (short-subunit alcohol dehydrogenase family)
MSGALEGKVAIVTGAGRPTGIGQCYAEALARAGAAVVTVDVDGAGAEAVAKELADDGLRATGLGGDVTDLTSMRDVVHQATEAFGGVDILVNNAALMADLARAPLTEYPLDEWDRIFDVNVKGVLICCQAVVDAMRARGGGAIVNQSSAAAFPPATPYGLSKLAVAGLTIALARQLGRDGIRVNAIAPGLVDTEAGFRLAPEGSEIRRRRQEAAALTDKAFGLPRDLVGALLLLTSDAGSWITGQTLHVDGGWVMQT